MPKEARHPSSKSVVISLSLPWTDDRKAFIQACVGLANKEARLFWDNRTGRTRNKGGRPSVKQDIYSACDGLWAEWGGKFPARTPTLTYFLEKAKEHTKKRTGKTISPNTLKKHVKGWMDGSVAIYDAPLRQRVQYFNIQWVMGVIEYCMRNEELRIMLGHLVKDQRNQPMTISDVEDILGSAQTQALITEEWAKNPTIKEWKATKKKLQDIASDPKKLQIWKRNMLTTVDAIPHE